MLKNTAEDKKDELNKLLNTPHFRESIKQTLITRKTIKRLVEIAEGSSINDKVQQKEEQK